MELVVAPAMWGGTPLYSAGAPGAPTADIGIALGGGGMAINGVPAGGGANMGAPIIGITGGAGAPGSDEEPAAPQGVDELMELLRSRVSVPQRSPDGEFHFAIDHCFPIKGQGTVVTGTVLSGAMRVNDSIYFPELKLTKKVKSIQMFKKPAQRVEQGDRCGMCVTQLDAKALERGIACTHGHVTLVSSALVAVRQIRYFKAPCKTGAKFHSADSGEW